MSRVTNPALRGSPLGTVLRVLNPVVRALLGSPVHWPLSTWLALLTFTGRKTGRRLTTPVSYVRDGNLAFLTTGDRWARNLSGGAPIQIRIRGQWLAGDAILITNREESVATHQRLFREHPWFRSLSGLPAAGRDGADPVALEHSLSAGRTLVRIALRPR